MTADTTPANVLLVEDSKFLRLANSQALTNAGYTVITAKDGEEALQITRKTPPDIIVLDLLLPKLSGLDTLRTLKKNPSTAQIPVVVLSCLSQINGAKLKEDGAAEYLEKSSLDGDKSGILAKTISEILNQQ